MTEEAALHELTLRLAHPDEGVREDAIRALGRCGHADVVALLRPRLADPLPYLRCAAADALADAAAEAAIEWIAPLLVDPDKWVRYGVAEALVRLGCVRGEPVLREAFADPAEQGTPLHATVDDLLDEIVELRESGLAIE